MKKKTAFIVGFYKWYMEWSQHVILSKHLDEVEFLYTSVSMIADVICIQLCWDIVFRKYISMLNRVLQLVYEMKSTRYFISLSKHLNSSKFVILGFVDCWYSMYSVVLASVWMCVHVGCCYRVWVNRRWQSIIRLCGISRLLMRQSLSGN